MMQEANMPRAEDCKQVCSNSLNRGTAAKFRFLRGLEIGITVVGIVLIWSVFFLPSLFYIPALSEASFIGQPDFATTNISLDSDDVNCSENFYADNGTCKPECGSWKTLSESTAAIRKVMGILGTAIGLVFSLIVLALACVEHKKMLKFPQIIVIYETINVSVMQVLLLIAYAGGSDLTCSSHDYLYVLSHPTPFCIISGVLMLYLFNQLTVFWIIQTAILFWRLVFPFHARYWEMQGYFKYVHIIMLIVGIVLSGVLPVVALSVDGYSTFDPPVICTLNDIRTTYVYHLPLTLILAIGVSLLWISLWKIIKDGGKGKRERTWVAEIKLSVVVIYFGIFALIFFVAVSVCLSSMKIYRMELKAYFECEGKGIHPGQTRCDRSTFERYMYSHLLLFSAVFLLVLVPAFNLVYVLNIAAVKQIFSKIHGFLCTKTKRFV